MANPSDVLSQLLEASWRGIPFPTLMVSTEGGHNVVPHKRVDRDGWRVENTGRNSYTFQLKIPFVNKIVRGPGETWANLYPQTYRKMITAVEDRSTGVFVHPGYGVRLCKVGPYSTNLDPDFRGGEVMSLTLLETVDSGDAVALSQTSAIPIAATAAADLDNVIGAMSPPPDTGTPRGMSLADFLRSIGTISDEWDLAKMQWEGSINKVVNAVSILEEKFGATPGFSDKTERLISALHALKAQALKRDKATKAYTVLKATTVPFLANHLKNIVSDLFKLNPFLAKGPIVPANIRVRYYV